MPFSEYYYTNVDNDIRSEIVLPDCCMRFVISPCFGLKINRTHVDNDIILEIALPDCCMGVIAYVGIRLKIIVPT